MNSNNKPVSLTIDTNANKVLTENISKFGLTKKTKSVFAKEIFSRFLKKEYSSLSPVQSYQSVLSSNYVLYSKLKAELAKLLYLLSEKTSNNENTSCPFLSDYEQFMALQSELNKISKDNKLQFNSIIKEALQKIIERIDEPKKKLKNIVSISTDDLLNLSITLEKEPKSLSTFLNENNATKGQELTDFFENTYVYKHTKKHIFLHITQKDSKVSFFDFFNQFNLWDKSKKQNLCEAFSNVLIEYMKKNYFRPIWDKTLMDYIYDITKTDLNIIEKEKITFGIRIETAMRNRIKNENLILFKNSEVSYLASILLFYSRLTDRQQKDIYFYPTYLAYDSYKEKKKVPLELHITDEQMDASEEKNEIKENNPPITIKEPHLCINNNGEYLWVGIDIKDNNIKEILCANVDYSKSNYKMENSKEANSTELIPNISEHMVKHNLKSLKSPVPLFKVVVTEPLYKLIKKTLICCPAIEKIDSDTFTYYFRCYDEQLKNYLGELKKLHSNSIKLEEHVQEISEIKINSYNYSSFVKQADEMTI